MANPFGEQLGQVATAVPGPKSHEYAERLIKVESPAASTIKKGDIPIVWDETRGANIKDVDGNVFVDLIAGFCVASTGHSNPRIVEAIYRQQPAALAGVQPGDVVTHWGGTEITCVSQLAMAVADAQIGANVEVRLIRGREPLTVTVRVAQQPRGQDGQAVEGI